MMSSSSILQKGDRTSKRALARVCRPVALITPERACRFVQASRFKGEYGMKKFAWVVGGALLLAACGGSQDTRVPVALGSLVTPASAPWLQVEEQAKDVEVRGLDHSLALTPTPSVSEVLQARLRHALQPAYFTDLVVQCEQVFAEMRVDTEATPSSVTLELGSHCTINARGRGSDATYHVSPSMPAPAHGDYAKALASLLATGADDIARQLRANVEATPH
jgi:hypothetical protein